MNRALLESIRCPHCRTTLELEEIARDPRSVARGTLACGRCGLLVPIEGGFPFFTLADVARRDPRPLLGTPDEYGTYKERKFERGEIEMYAAFHPFNESFRAMEPLLPVLTRRLGPGDVILEPWARTGWTAVWLAARFPAQRIVALWEGDTSVLGYRGFAHWFREEIRPDNLDVLFVHPDHGLPFADGSVAAVVSHDCFHRFGIETFGGELLRIAAPDAPIVLAHVHLSNSEPDPWFERGGTIRHGREYRAWLDRITVEGCRKGWIWSEGDLFDAAAGLPPDDPLTNHYNGLMLIAEGIDDPGADLPLHAGETRLLLNPLYQLHMGRSAVRLDRNHLQGLVGHMLDRHPVYQPRLERDLTLSDLDWLIVVAAVSGILTGELPNAIGVDHARTREALERLQSCELLLGVDAPDAMHKMQRFHANQLPPGDSFLDLGMLGAGATLRGPDGFELNGDEIADSLGLVAGALKSLGVRQGTCVQIPAFSHPVPLLVLLGALALGADVELGVEAEQLVVSTDGERRSLSFGWNGEADGFLTILERASPTTLAPVGCSGSIMFRQIGETAAVRTATFLEAAASLRHATAQPYRMDGLTRVSDWLGATSGLMGGSDVRIG